MPTAKDLSGYPDWFWTITERAKTLKVQRVELTDRNSGYVLRRNYYAWRKILDRQGHPARREALGLMIRLIEYPEFSGAWHLEFSEVGGLTQDAQNSLMRVGDNDASKAEPPQSHSSPVEFPLDARNAEALQPGEDATEDFVAGFMKSSKKENI